MCKVTIQRRSALYFHGSSSTDSPATCSPATCRQSISRTMKCPSANPMLQIWLALRCLQSSDVWWHFSSHMRHVAHGHSAYRYCVVLSIQTCLTWLGSQGIPHAGRHVVHQRSRRFSIALKADEYWMRPAAEAKLHVRLE